MVQINVYFKKMQSSEAVEAAARSKTIREVRRFLSDPVTVDITFEVTNHKHRVHCHIHKGHEYNETFDEATDDMYTTIDVITRKIQTSLARYHRLKNKIDHFGAKNLNEVST